MKVTFECEKCGVVLASGSTISERLPDIEMDAAGSACRCAQLTYGPLTEEMVAEALEDVDMVADDFAGYRQMARFVLRLLREARGIQPDLWADACLTDWRDWLMDLARDA